MIYIELYVCIYIELLIILLVIIYLFVSNRIFNLKKRGEFVGKDFKVIYIWM